MATDSKLTKHQVKREIVEGFRIDGGYGRLEIRIRFDDECNNGHNTFAITGTIYRDDREWGSGCIHDDIREFAPHLEPLLKWHLCSTDGPMHYIANTVHFASDRDCWGGRKGEPKTVVYLIKMPGGGFLCDATRNPDAQYHGLPTVQSFKTREDAQETAQHIDGSSVVEWVQTTHEGKERELDSARAAAIWPDATDEELTAEPDELKKKLADRLPGLMAEFRTAVESLGFTW